MSSPVLARNEHFQNNAPGNHSLASAEVMTTENTLQKTAALFGILLVTAGIGWFMPILALPAALAGLVLGIVNAVRREPSVPLIITYAAVEGVFVGGISGIFENIFPGIVMQAVLATLVVTGVVLALFTSGRVRATPRMTKFFMIAIVSYLVFSLLNFVLMMTGVTEGMFGARSYEIMGIPIGIFIGLFAVLLATYSLILDFTFIQQGVNNRVPARYGWTAAFGLMVTIVWLYVEILRIIGLSRS
jgi:uncharacterized YccA/Bax inhibitor family protein